MAPTKQQLMARAAAERKARALNRQRSSAALKIQSQFRRHVAAIRVHAQFAKTFASRMADLDTLWTVHPDLQLPTVTLVQSILPLLLQLPTSSVREDAFCKLICTRTSDKQGTTTLQQCYRLKALAGRIISHLEADLVLENVSTTSEWMIEALRQMYTGELGSQVRECVLSIPLLPPLEIAKKLKGHEFTPSWICFLQLAFESWVVVFTTNDTHDGIINWISIFLANDGFSKWYSQNGGRDVLVSVFQRFHGSAFMEWEVIGNVITSAYRESESLQDSLRGVVSRSELQCHSIGLQTNSSREKSVLIARNVYSLSIACNTSLFSSEKNIDINAEALWKRLATAYYGRSWCNNHRNVSSDALADASRAKLLWNQIKIQEKSDLILSAANLFTRASLLHECGKVDEAISDLESIVKFSSKVIGISKWKAAKAKLQSVLKLQRDRDRILREAAAAEIKDKDANDDTLVLETDEALAVDTVASTKKRKKKRKKKNVAAVSTIVPSGVKSEAEKALRATEKRELELKAKAMAQDNIAKLEAMQLTHQEVTKKIGEQELIAQDQYLNSVKDSIQHVSRVRKKAGKAEIETTRVYKKEDDELYAQAQVAKLEAEVTEALSPDANIIAVAAATKVQDKAAEISLDAASCCSKTSIEYVLDGPNIGYFHGRNLPSKTGTRRFSSKGVKLALDYYNKGNTEDAKAVAFLPQRFVESRYEENLADDIEMLGELMRQQVLFLTPSRVNDDLFFLKFARMHQCNMVTNDNLLDHVEAAADKKEVSSFVRERTTKFMFIRDQFMPI